MWTLWRRSTTELRERILEGGGPQFLWARTWRLTGHTAVDKAAYRDAGEVEERWKDDPVARAADTLRTHGVAGGNACQPP